MARDIHNLCLVNNQIYAEVESYAKRCLPMSVNVSQLSRWSPAKQKLYLDQEGLRRVKKQIRQWNWITIRCPDTLDAIVYEGLRIFLKWWSKERLKLATKQTSFLLDEWYSGGPWCIHTAP